MITLKTLERALWCVNQSVYKFVTFSGFGETFAHPQIKEIFTMTKNAGIYVSVPSNGILLTEDVLRHCLENNLIQLEISIHTEKSLVAYKMAYDIVHSEYPKVKLLGNIVECNVSKLQKWAEKQQVTPEQLKSIRVLATHNWAMNEREYTEEENKKWQANCEFLNHDLCVIRWDGKVNTCCVDDSGVNYVGHIDDFPNLTHKPAEYKLCHKCSPAWFNGAELGWFLSV